MTRDTVGKLISMLLLLLLSHFSRVRLCATRAIKKKKRKKKKTKEEKGMGVAVRRKVAVLISVVREGSLAKVTT